jgi:hypothetical protein
MTNQNENFDSVSGGIGTLAELDKLIRNSTSSEKLREELLAQREWFLDRLQNISRQASRRQSNAGKRTLYVVAASNLPSCSWNVNELNLQKLCQLVGRNDGELQMQLFDEWEQDGWLCLCFCNSAEAEEVLAILLSSIEFKAGRRTDAAGNDRLEDALRILTQTGGRITIARLIETATYLGFRLRIAIANS